MPPGERSRAAPPCESPPGTKTVSTLLLACPPDGERRAFVKTTTGLLPSAPASKRVVSATEGEVFFANCVGISQLRLRVATSEWRRRLTPSSLCCDNALLSAIASLIR